MLLAAMLLLMTGKAGACNEAAPAQLRPSVMLMSGLPLVWGEKGPFEPGSKPAAAYVELGEDYAFEPVDLLDTATLARGRLLFLVQPKRLAPAELAAVDGWIRSGGRALILTDPMLHWPSELPAGDIRRPPPVGMLGPLLGHWRLTLEAPAVAGEVRASWQRRRLMLDSPGRFRSANPECSVGPDDWTALCRLGRGTVRLVADADLMRDPVWNAADNRAAVGSWLDELAGVKRPRRGSGDVARWGLLALVLSFALSGVAFLLRRRRKRANHILIHRPED